jgi:aquaporin Z
LWVYFAAPLTGMLLAAETYVRTGRARVAHCAKLHHENGQRCIFFCRYGELR